jgi:Bifunctional DNA primase/polymerase, N-terminal
MTAATVRPGTAMLSSALDYARRDWPVFPCWPGRKEPLTTHGFKDATVDLDRITYWWRRHPAANIAIATGQPGPDVFDVDVKPDGTGWPAFDRLRRAGRLAGASMLVSTRNGGAHVYFAGTDQPCSSIGKLHLDFRAVGGYVLVAPSVVPADDWAPQGTGRYTVVWTRDSDIRLDWASCRALLTPRLHRPPLPRPARADLDRLPPWLCDRLAVVPRIGDRSEHFHGIVGGCHFAGLDLPQTITVLQTWPPGVDKYGDRLAAEVERSWIKIGGAI